MSFSKVKYHLEELKNEFDTLAERVQTAIEMGEVEAGEVERMAKEKSDPYVKAINEGTVVELHSHLDDGDSGFVPIGNMEFPEHPGDDYEWKLCKVKKPGK